MKLLSAVAMLLLCSTNAFAQQNYAHLSIDLPSYMVGEQAQLSVHLNTSLLREEDEFLIETNLQSIPLSLIQQTPATIIYLSQRFPFPGDYRWSVNIFVRNKILNAHLKAKINMVQKNISDLKSELQYATDQDTKNELELKLRNMQDDLQGLNDQVKQLPKFKEQDFISISVL